MWAEYKNESFEAQVKSVFKTAHSTSEPFQLKTGSATIKARLSVATLEPDMLIKHSQESFCCSMFPDTPDGKTDATLLWVGYTQSFSQELA